MNKYEKYCISHVQLHEMEECLLMQEKYLSIWIMCVMIGYEKLDYICYIILFQLYFTINISI